jgi:hypothetical protein
MSGYNWLEQIPCEWIARLQIDGRFLSRKTEPREIIHATATGNLFWRFITLIGQHKYLMDLAQTDRRLAESNGRIRDSEGFENE